MRLLSLIIQPLKERVLPGSSWIIYRVAATGQGHSGQLAIEYLPGVVTVRMSVSVKVLMVVTQVVPPTTSTGVGFARPCAGMECPSTPDLVKATQYSKCALFPCSLRKL